MMKSELFTCYCIIMCTGQAIAKEVPQAFVPSAPFFLASSAGSQALSLSSRQRLSRAAVAMADHHPQSSAPQLGRRAALFAVAAPAAVFLSQRQAVTALEIAGAPKMKVVSDILEVLGGLWRDC